MHLLTTNPQTYPQLINDLTENNGWYQVHAPETDLAFTDPHEQLRLAIYWNGDAGRGCATLFEAGPEPRVIVDFSEQTPIYVIASCLEMAAERADTGLRANPGALDFANELNRIGFDAARSHDPDGAVETVYTSDEFGASVRHVSSDAPGAQEDSWWIDGPGQGWHIQLISPLGGEVTWMLGACRTIDEDAGARCEQAARPRPEPGPRAAPSAEPKPEPSRPLTARVVEIETTIGRTVNGGPLVTRIYHCGPYTIRASVGHDTSRSASHASAEVLTPNLEWTLLYALPREEFHYQPGARSKATRRPRESDLLQLAEDLAVTACRILRPATADEPSAPHFTAPGWQEADSGSLPAASGAAGPPTQEQQNHAARALLEALADRIVAHPEDVLRLLRTGARAAVWGGGDRWTASAREQVLARATIALGMAMNISLAEAENAPDDAYRQLLAARPARAYPQLLIDAANIIALTGLDL